MCVRTCSIIVTGQSTPRYPNQALPLSVRTGGLWRQFRDVCTARGGTPRLAAYLDDTAERIWQSDPATHALPASTAAPLSEVATLAMPRNTLLPGSHIVWVRGWCEHAGTDTGSYAAALAAPFAATATVFVRVSPPRVRFDAVSADAATVALTGVGVGTGTACLWVNVAAVDDTHLQHTVATRDSVAQVNVGQGSATCYALTPDNVNEVRGCRVAQPP